MKQSERERLLAACRAMARSNPELQLQQAESPAESAASIEGEIAGFLGAVLGDRQAVYRTAEESLQPLMMLFDIALLQICDMSQFSHEHAESRASIIWPNNQFPKRPRPNDVFYVLSSNLSHAMQAFRLLILHGFESQARAAFRSVVELADLMIMVLADEGVYSAYITSLDDDKAAYLHWKKRLSPGVIRTSLATLEEADPIVLPIDVTQEEIRKEHYAWLSRFLHVDYAVHVIAVHPADAAGRWQRLAMLGNVGETSKATLAHALIYLWITLLRLEKLLFEQHGWDRMSGTRSRHWFSYRARTMDALFGAYLPTFWEVNPPLGMGD